MHDQRIILLLKTTGLKIFSRQEKIIFTTCCFKNKFLVKATPIKLHFMFLLEVHNKIFHWFPSLCPFNKISSTRQNTCVLICLVSSKFDARDHVTEKNIVSQLESFLKSESLGYLDRIKFDNKIITYCVREEGGQHRSYSIVKEIKQYNLTF